MTTGIELATGSDDDAARQAGIGTRQHGAGFSEQRSGEQSEVAVGRARTQTHAATTSRPSCARLQAENGFDAGARRAQILFCCSTRCVDRRQTGTHMGVGASAERGELRELRQSGWAHGTRAERSGAANSKETRGRGRAGRAPSRELRARARHRA
jgi:hypothetical protein